jgi:hypothetical protein
VKPIDVRRATGWMRQHSRLFSSAQMLAEGAAEELGLYTDNDGNIPDELLNIAKGILHQ